MTEQEAVALSEVRHAQRGSLLCDFPVWQRLQMVAEHHLEVAGFLPGSALYDAALGLYRQYEFSDRIRVLLSDTAETQALFRMCDAYGISEDVLWRSLFA